MTCAASWFRIFSNGYCYCNSNGYIEVNNIVCSQCHFSCQSCNGLLRNNCLNCSSSSFRIFNPAINICTCPDIGYFESNITVCGKCHSSCNRCNNSSAETACKDCVGNRFFFQGMCLLVCPSGFYAVNETNKCEICNSRCFTCSGNPTNCTKCADVRVNLPQCTCPVGTLEPYIDQSCVPCQPQCETCLSTPGNCVSCKANRVPGPLPACICPVGTYEVSGQIVCQPCSSTCATCRGG